MADLAATQAAFAAALMGEPDEALLTAIVDDGVPPAERLDIHRNTRTLTLTQVLADSFPAVHTLVGDGFFKYAAAQFIGAHPPRSGSLLDYGADFAAFLDAFPAARQVAYLGDVARLEWARQECANGPDSRPLDPRALSELTGEQAASARFGLHANHRLVRSDHPIHDIWLACQAEGEADAQVDLGVGQTVLVIRPDLELLMWPLTAGEAALVDAFARSLPLTSAIEVALSADPAFDLQAGLTTLLSRRVFADKSAEP